MGFLKQIKYKDKAGKVIPMSIKVDAANVQEDSEHRFITDTDKNNFTAKMNTNGNASNTTATFTAASTRANITSNEKLSVIFGKIAKYFTDLKAVAFTGSYSDLSNKPTIPTVPGSLKNPYALKLNGKTYDGSVATDAGTMGIAYGGTGATTAANARTNLGLGASATQAVANNLATTAAGSVLDARQGKVLNDNIAQINDNIDNLNGSLDTKLDKNKVNLLNKAKGIGIDVVSEDYGNSTQCLAVIELLTQQDGSGKYVLEIWNNNLVCFYIDNNGWHRLWNMR